MTELSSLLADLTCADDQRAEAAAQELPGYGEAAFTALQGLLHSGHADTRWWAVRALADLDARERLEEVDRLRSDPDESVRRAAEETASQFRAKPRGEQ